MVYVLSKAGEPLMPTKNYGKIRILLKQNKAKIVDYKPFTIQLLYETTSYSQTTILGIDPGRVYISGTVVLESDGSVLYSSELKTRNKDIPKLMFDRKMYRQQRRRNRRQRKIRIAKRNGTTYPRTKNIKQPGTKESIPVKYIRNKPSRFSNRFRPDGWLTPTANHLLETHLNYINKITKLLPVTKIVIEYARFDIHKLNDPTIKGIQYQRGALYGYNNLREYIYHRQSGKCLLCSKPKINDLHHIESRSDNGSHHHSNTAGLCKHCHTKVQTDQSYDTKLREKLRGIKKSFDSTSILNTIMLFLSKELQQRFAHVSLTYGYITQTTRQIYNLSKTHTIDSYLIALEEVTNPEYLNIPSNIPTPNIHYYKQFRRHNRRLCAATRNRYYKLNDSMIANNRNKRMDQKAPSLAEYRQILLEKHPKKQVDHHISKLKVTPSIKRYNTPTQLIPVRSGDTVLYQGIRQSVSGYFNKGKTLRLVSMPTNNIPVKECQLLLRNTGIVCI